MRTPSAVALTLAVALGLGPGCVARRAFQVPPCLVPHHHSEGATRSWLGRLGATAFVEPIVEDDLLALYGECTPGPRAEPLCKFKPSMSTEERNAILERVITRCDVICDNHKTSFVSQGVLAKTAFGIASIGLTGAGSLVGGATANAVSAAATATQGTEKAISKEIYADRVSTAIASSIAAEQTKRLQLIREHEARSTMATYPVWAGLRDIQEYHDTCSFATGLGLLQDDAAVEKDEADKARAASERRDMQFQKDPAGDAIRAFWKPDGTNVDAANAARIKAWMKEHDLEGVSITLLMRGNLFHDARTRMANDLKLTAQGG
jgi:hypothetical protein